MAGDLSEQQVRVLLGEGLRSELVRIIALQDDADLGASEIDARIMVLEAENERLRQQARRNDLEDLRPWLAAAARSAGIELPAAVDAGTGRRAARLRREIGEVEAAVLDGDPVEELAAALVRRFSSATVREFVEEPVTLSAALARTAELYPSPDMRGNLKICADLLHARFGDVSMQSIDEAMLLDLFAWAYRLPKAHGKRTNGTKRSKDEEIAIADAADRAARDEILAIPGLSNEERRRRLADRLVPRLTLTTLKRYRDSVNRVFKGAEALGAKGLAKVPGYKRVETHLKAITERIRREEDILFHHACKPKRREPWSEERLTALFESPIYRGCLSQHRRWQPGDVIVRDALYWVPLLLSTLGTRIGELLALRPGDLRQLNGTICLRIAMDQAAPGKTEDASRHVPVPQVVLDLGFAEWVAEKAAAGETLLFAEVAERADRKGSSLTDAFFRIRDQVWKHLGLSDASEDCYALRKTLQSLLDRQGVSEGRRQALAGHRNGATINRHYTAVHMRSLKVDVDRVGYRIEVSHSDRHGHPVILRCGIGDDLPEAEVRVELGRRGIAAVSIVEGERSLAVRCGDVQPRDLADALPPEMAERLAQDGFRRPQRGPEGEALDQLCAFAAVRVGAAHAVSRRRAVAEETDRLLRDQRMAAIKESVMIAAQ